MLVFAFSPVDMEFLAWVGMVPLFFALSGKNKAKAFFIGLLWGVVFFLGTVYWVVNSMANYGGVPFLISLLILFALAVYLGLFPALFGFGISTASSPEMSLLSKILFASCLWVGLEYIRANMITAGFPWVLLGYSQSLFPQLIQIADITGVYGISFLIVLVNMVVFFALSYWLGKGKSLPVKEGLLIFIILIGVLAYGFFRIDEVDRISANWKRLKIGVAQGNIDQGRKWDIAFQKEIVDIYKRLSLALAKQGARLIIWPESAVPFFLQSDKNFGPEIMNLPKQTGAFLLSGADTYGYGHRGETRYYNSALLLSPEGEIVGKYDKIHLVPFGEYVPLKRHLPFIHKLVVGAGDFSSGKALSPLEFDDKSFGVLICFESIFPELARGFAKEGAGFLVNITNDAWFGKSSAPYQHFSQGVFRAVENKMFLVRAANTGISGVVDPVGRVVRKSGIFTEEAMIEDIRAKDANLFTFYSRYGDIFAIGCLILSAGFLLLILRKGTDYV